MRAPASLGAVEEAVEESRVSAREMCSSDVPGGVSIRRNERFLGHNTEVRNCRTMAVFLGPRQTTAEDRLGRRKPRDIMCKDPVALIGTSLAECAPTPLESVLPLAGMLGGEASVGSAFTGGGSKSFGRTCDG